MVKNASQGSLQLFPGTPSWTKGWVQGKEGRGGEKGTLDKGKEGEEWEMSRGE